MRYLETIRLLVAMLCACATSVLASNDCVKARAGINLAGAEFGKNVPGREGFDYRFPTASQVSYFSKVGFQSIRLPIRWERLQPELKGSLDRGYLAGIVSLLDSAAANGMDVLIDLHNYARYRGELVGSKAVPADSFFDVWKRIAFALRSHKAVYAYGLMNEPYQTGGLWHQVAQSGIDGIRSVDQSHRIYVSGEGFSNTRLWGELNDSPFVQDPRNLEVYEGHVYLDAGGSGKYVSSDSTKDPGQLAAERLEPFIEWLVKYEKNGAIGEYGVPSDDVRWFRGVDRVLQVSQSNCLPTYVWAGGNWSPGYKLSLEPLNGADRPLTRHFSQILGQDAR